MIPLSQLGLELLLGTGAALFGANLWVLLRPRIQGRRPGRPVPRPPSVRRVMVNMLVGAVIGLWAMATLLRR